MWQFEDGLRVAEAQANLWLWGQVPLPECHQPTCPSKVQQRAKSRAQNQERYLEDCRSWTRCCAPQNIVQKTRRRWGTYFIVAYTAAEGDRELCFLIPPDTACGGLLCYVPPVCTVGGSRGGHMGHVCFLRNQAPTAPANRVFIDLSSVSNRGTVSQEGGFSG